MNIANILKELRNENKFTQQEIANKLGITRSAYSNYEQGIREPSITELKNLANIFDVSLDYLLGKTDDEYIKIYSPAAPISKEEREILNYFNAMSAGQRAEARGFMRGMLAAGGINIETLNKGV